MFDCAFKAAKGQRSIHYMGHIKMMGATQPFISGAISQDGQRAEGGDRRGHQAGLHRVVEARREGDLDLPRRQQADAAAQHVEGQDRRRKSRRRRPRALVTQPVRRKLPDERQAITHKFDIAGHEGYITVGLFEDGQPGEIFLVMAKEGSTISGFADAFAQAISYALQYGVPLQALVDKFSHVRFEPSGMTRNPEIRFAKSIVDYIFRWLASKFLSPEAQFHAGVNGRELESAAAPSSCRRRRRRPPSGARRPPRRRRDAVLDDSEPGRRAAVLDVRLDHDPQRRLLQVRQLRQHERLRVGIRASGFGIRDQGLGENARPLSFHQRRDDSRPLALERV